jgi:ATP-dependent protease ClpP protease subunit
MSALERTKAHITAHIDGIAASMATAIAMIADEVKMSDNGMFMIHNAPSCAVNQVSASIIFAICLSVFPVLRV